MSLSRWGRAPWPPLRVPEEARRGGPAPAGCDVAVIGGGLSGLACGLSLLRRGVRVSVIEARSIGAGASGRSGGIVLEDTAAGPLAGVGQCIAALEGTVKELGIGCDLWLGTGWELAHRAASGVPGWKDGGGPLEAQSVVPAGTLDPAALVGGLAGAFLGAGGTIVEGHRVEGVAERPGSSGPVTVRFAGKGQLVAGHVLIGLNAYSASLLGAFAGVRSALTLALCTAPLGQSTLEAIGLAGGTPFYTIDVPYLWGRPLRDGRVIFGGGVVFDPENAPERIGIHAGEAAVGMERLERRVRGLHPQLRDVQIERRWGGPVAFRPGRRPLLTRLAEGSRVIVCGAYAGHGVALPFRIAGIVADAIVEGRELPEWGGPEPPP